MRTRVDEKGNTQAEEKPPGDSEFTDRVRWIDTDVMGADGLTKLMDLSALTTFTSSNSWSLEQPHESKLEEGEAVSSEENDPRS